MLLWFSATAAAATLEVCATCAYATVGDAVAAATDGDTIYVDPGVYDETDVVIDMNLRLIGAGSDVTTLRSDSDQVLQLGSPDHDFYDTYTISVSGFELAPSNGRGITIDKVGAILADIYVHDVAGTTSGLGVAVGEGSPVTIADSTFEDLDTTGYGAAILHGSSYELTVTGSTFERNSAAGGGGAIFSSGRYMTLESCSFVENTGRAVVAYGALYSLSNTFTGNEGAIAGGSSFDSLSSSYDTFTGNSAEYGAAILGGNISVGGAVFTNNTATVDGADIYSSVDGSSVWVGNSIISGSTGSSVQIDFIGRLLLSGVSASGIDAAGGCAFSSGADSNGLSVSGSVFDDIDGSALCSSRGGTGISTSSFSNITGSAVFVSSADLWVTDCTFTDNGLGVNTSWTGYGTMPSLHVSSSSFSGHTWGGIYADNLQIAVSDSQFTGNSSSYDGAAITASNSRGAILDGNTFSGNAAPLGGAVYLWSPHSDVSLENNRFCENEADHGGAVAVGAGSTAITMDGTGNIFVDNTATTAGGDLYLADPAILVNNTFVGGYAPTGGSVWSDDDLDFRNNIVAHTSEYALYGAGGTATVTYNDFWGVVPDAVGGTWPAADSSNIAVDPLWVSYVEGGCESLDLALTSGSPLLDAGDPSTTDGDGSPADIGATGGSSPAEGTTWWYLDADGDGYGASEGAYGLTLPSGHAAETGDCDDADAGRFPENTEYCDGVDEDCDGDIDEDAVDTATWALDADGDGYTSGSTVSSCTAPDGWTTPSDLDDCDDADASVNPAASEVCDGVDNNCRGWVDEGMPTWRRDLDGDGWQGSAYERACEAPEGYVASDLPPYDCDDADTSVSPAGIEVCNGMDEDCDGAIDDGVLRTWRPDADGDGYQSFESVAACEPPDGWTEKSGLGDCDDGDPMVNPAAAEVCDHADQDCDGEVDEGVETRWRADADDDGFQAERYVEACEPPEGWQEDAGGPYDCDDDASDVYPGAIDLPADDVDQDCDGEDSADPPDTDGPGIATGGGCKGCDGGGDPTWALLAGLLALGTRRRIAITGP